MQTFSRCVMSRLPVTAVAVDVKGVTDMGSRGRFVLMCLVVLILSASGSSARNSSSIADAVRVPSTEPSIVHSQKRDLPWATQADIRERQMVAWIILLMKDGRSAR
jgi:hypothetical protein